MTSRTPSTPSILKQRSAAPVKLSFQCDAALAERLTALEKTAKEAGLQIEIDAPLTATLARLIAQAEKELAPKPGREQGGKEARSAVQRSDVREPIRFEEQRGSSAWQSPPSDGD